MAGPQANRFGELLITTLRDPLIDHADDLLAASSKAPGHQRLQAELQSFTPEQRAIMRRWLMEALDGGLHDFLFALDKQGDDEGDVAVLVAGQNIAEQSDGLHGELYSDAGWIARFSKHRGPSMAG